MPGNFEKTMRQVPNVAAMRDYARQFNEAFAEVVGQRFNETRLYENFITLIANRPNNWRNLILQTEGRNRAQIGQMVTRLPIDERDRLRDDALEAFRVANVGLLIRRIRELKSHFDLDIILHLNMYMRDFMDSDAANR